MSRTDTLRHPAQSHGRFDSRADFKVLINTGVVEHHVRYSGWILGFIIFTCYVITYHKDTCSSGSFQHPIPVTICVCGISATGKSGIVSSHWRRSINALMSDGFAESMNFSRMEASPFYWPMIYRSLIDCRTACILSHGYNNYLQKRERMHIF